MKEWHKTLHKYQEEWTNTHRENAKVGKVCYTIKRDKCGVQHMPQVRSNSP
jgi:hypothetical protein